MSGKNAVTKPGIENRGLVTPHNSLTQRLLKVARLAMPGGEGSSDIQLRKRKDQVPDLVIEHRNWRNVWKSLLNTMIPGHGGVFGLLGEGGTGKTLLLRRLFDELRAGGEQVELFKGGEAPSRKSSASVLLIDDAGLLDNVALAELTCPCKRRVILAGQPAFSLRLPASIATVTLLRLADAEARDFLSTFLRASTRLPLVLSDEAEARLVGRSNGIPRVLRNLASGAVMLAETAGTDRIEMSHIRQAETLADRIDGSLARVSVTRPKPPSIVTVASGLEAVTQSAVSSVVPSDTLAEVTPDVAPLPSVTIDKMPSPRMSVAVAICALVTSTLLFDRSITADSNSSSQSAAEITASSRRVPEQHFATALLAPLLVSSDLASIEHLWRQSGIRRDAGGAPPA